jgi:phosphoribosylformylglycinamidine synthase
MQFLVKVFVTPKQSILDPQGRAIEHSLKSLGFEPVQAVRVGKFITFQLEAASVDRARDVASRMCDQLLANTVIEDYRVEVEP